MAAGPALNNAVSPPLESMRAELLTIRRSTVFGSAPRLQKLLGYLVEESLAGNPLKESIVGVAVFGRDPGYDPKQDSVVRSEVRRLRAKLIEYYASEGAGDKIVIDLPKGSYVPACRFRETAVLPAPPALPRRARTMRLSGGVAASVVLVLVAVILAGYELRAPGVPTAAVARRSVAVLNFRNLTGRPEAGWLASAIPEMISADLADGQQIRTIPGENVSRMETELALQPAASPSRETLSAIRRNLGADIVVSGAYAALGAGTDSRVRVDIWAEDARSGEVIAAVSESGTEPEILDLMFRAGARLRGGLRLETTPASELAVRDASPRDPEAARAYADALAHMRRGDFLQGRDLLRQCIQIEAGFAPAHAALSSAEAKLGYEGLAREEARRAYDLAPGIRNQDAKLAIEAQYREVNHEPGQAAQVYARLFAEHPDDIEYGLHLAAAQAADDKVQDALRTVEALRRLPAAEAADPRIDMEAARALAARSDYRRSAELAAAAAHKAAAANAKLLYARAVSFESGLLWNLGDGRWRGLSEEARKICGQFQDKACVAAVLRRFGNVSLGALDLQSADRYYGAALAIAREIGSVAEESNVLNGMALSANCRGDLNQAAAILRQMVALSRQTRDQGREQQGLSNLGDVLLAMGQVDAARENIEPAVKIARALGAHEAMADDLASLADVYRIQGNLARALEACEQAWANARETGTVNSQVAVLSRKASILLAEDDQAGARAALRQYDRLRTASVDVSAWRDWLLPAAIELAADRPAEAAALAQDAIRDTADHRLPWEQARAEALLAESLLAQGELAKARASAAQARDLVRSSQQRLARLEVGISYARVTGQADELPAIVSEARSMHAFELELKGRLAEAQLSRDGAQLAALRIEAATHGFRYLARRCDEASAGVSH
ncbi:MAG TPA: tetratricopeptide repeat protein [Bryobacteraceae bacterium]|nr:tetratricopeptide repeat protein [Bryobacteraceae bacterium]